MNVLATVMSMSRFGGGLQGAVRDLYRTMHFQSAISTTVVAPVDRFSSVDHGDWEPVNAIATRTSGPRQLAYLPELRRILDMQDPSLIHNHGLWIWSGQESAAWAKRKRRPYIVSLHGMLEPEWELRKSRWKKHIASALFERKHLVRATCIHALCVEEVRHIRAFGLSNPVCVIPNGVALPVSPLEEICNVRSRKAGKRRILYLGRLNQKKGLAELLVAWKAAREACSPLTEWELAIAGWDQNNHAHELVLLVQQHGLSDTVKFLGPLFGVNKVSAFSLADAFILPSFSEGLPLVVIEAWSFGLPVLMTTRCNLPEGEDAGAAFIVEPGASAITGGLKKLVALSDGERIEMGKRGRKLVEARFTWNRVACQMAAVYQWMLGGETPQGVELHDG